MLVDCVALISRCSHKRTGVGVEDGEWESRHALEEGERVEARAMARAAAAGREVEHARLG